jgi:hypothetical protein
VIGGKVLDASALAALVRGRLSAVAWFATAETTGMTLYLPSLALTEVRAVRPDAGPLLAEVIGHPSVILGEFDAATADQVDELLSEADVFDALAGHVVHIAGNAADLPSPSTPTGYTVSTLISTSTCCSRVREALAPPRLMGKRPHRNQRPYHLNRFLRLENRIPDKARHNGYPHLGLPWEASVMGRLIALGRTTLAPERPRQLPLQHLRIRRPEVRVRPNRPTLEIHPAIDQFNHEQRWRARHARPDAAMYAQPYGHLTRVVSVIVTKPLRPRSEATRLRTEPLITRFIHHVLYPSPLPVSYERHPGPGRVHPGKKRGGSGRLPAKSLPVSTARKMSVNTTCQA